MKLARSRTRAGLILLVATLAMNSWARPSHADGLYRITDFSALPGDTGTIVTGMSSDGGRILIGSGTDSGAVTYYVSSNNSTPVTSTGLTSAPSGVNNNGDVAASSTFQAAAINNLGQIVGQNSDGQVLLQTGSQVSNLGGLYADASNLPTAINDSGQIVGMSISPTQGIHPFLYSDGKFTNLGGTGGATAINAQGDVVGGDGTNTSSPFLYKNGQMIALGSLGGLHGLALGINATDQVVGWSFSTQNGSFAEHAFLYQNGTMVDLNDLIDPQSGLTLYQAVGIDDSGRIAVDARDAQGIDHALLLTPNAVPEPSSLIVASTVALAGYISRRRRSRGPNRSL